MNDNFQAEELMRDACTDLGSLAGICVNPLYGSEARCLPRNSYSLGMSFSQPAAACTVVLKAQLTLA